MFQKSSCLGYAPALPGIELKTLVHGEKMLMTEFLLEKGRQRPKHSHPHEQTGYLIKRHIRLTIGAKDYDVMPGDSWCLPGDVEHCAEIFEDSIAIEVFSPLREDYLPKQNKASR